FVTGEPNHLSRGPPRVESQAIQSGARRVLDRYLSRVRCDCRWRRPVGACHGLLPATDRADVCRLGRRAISRRSLAAHVAVAQALFTRAMELAAWQVDAGRDVLLPHA